MRRAVGAAGADAVPFREHACRGSASATTSAPFESPLLDEEIDIAAIEALEPRS